MPVIARGVRRVALVDVAAGAARLIPGARLTLLEEAGHGLQVEAPAEFSSAVLDFVAAQPAAQRAAG